jgi:hypothetical protein
MLARTRPLRYEQSAGFTSLMILGVCDLDFHLCRRPLIAKNYRDFGNAQFASRFQPQVAIDDFTRRF